MSDRFDYGEDASAQDVVDALRFVLTAQKNGDEFRKLAESLLEQAPETDNDRGIDLLMHLISEGSLAVSLA